MTEQATLLQDLQDESDLCRNEGATDIANLLDRAIAALQSAAQDRKDAELFAWYFSTKPKFQFLNDYMEGMREDWSLDQWRAAITAAMQTKEQG